jgi:hypothetical protein
MPRNKNKSARRNSATRNAKRTMRTKPKEAKSAKPQAAKNTAATAGANRSEGIRLFKLAGRPTKEQFVLVYGDRGPKMTWEQRAAARVPAEKFQAALAEKAVSRPAAAKPARTTKQTPTVPLAGA